MQPLSDELKAMMIADSGAGVSNDIDDRAFWHPDIDDNVDWYRALQAYHEHDNALPLVKMLQSDQPPTARILFLLGDVLYHRSNKRPGPSPTPAYDRTAAMARVESALLDVKQRVLNGIAVKDALAQVADVKRLSVETLDAAYNGRLGALRRARGHRLK